MRAVSLLPETRRRLRPAPEGWPRPDRIEQRPVAILQNMALGIGRARLQPERPDDAVVAIVALQDDPAQRRHSGPALRAESHRDRLAPRRAETGQRPPGKTRDL